MSARKVFGSFDRRGFARIMRAVESTHARAAMVRSCRNTVFVGPAAATSINPSSRALTMSAASPNTAFETGTRLTVVTLNGLVTAVAGVAGGCCARACRGRTETAITPTMRIGRIDTLSSHETNDLGGGALPHAHRPTDSHIVVEFRRPEDATRRPYVRNDTRQGRTGSRSRPPGPERSRGFAPGPNSYIQKPTTCVAFEDAHHLCLRLMVSPPGPLIMGEFA